MSFRSIRALRKAGALVKRRADGATVARTLDLPLPAGGDDPRLAIQKGIATGDRSAFYQAMRLDPKSGAAPLLAAYYAWIDGERDEADRLTTVALTLAPENVTAQAMRLILDLADGKIDGNRLSDPKLMRVLPVVTGPVQGELLRLVEERIAALAPDDAGAANRDDLLHGALGWLLDRFDDLALIIGWGAGHLLNTVIHLTRASRRRAYRHVIAGDLAEGFHKREKARASFLKAQSIDPANAESAESLIAFALEENDLTEATRRIDAYAKLLADAIGDPMANPFAGPQLRRWRADLAWLREEYATASTLYAKVADEDRYGWFPPYRQGLSALRMNDREGARKAFTETLNRIHPHLLEERLLKLAEL